mgnify:CR=1 FL=1
MTGRPVQMMGFGDAVKNAIVNNYANFSGRASRSEYWWFFLFTFLAGLVAVIIDALVFGVEPNGSTWEPYVTGYRGSSGVPTWVFWILQLALFLPSLAVAVRRIHDHGKSGWFVIVPLYNLYLVIVDGEAMPNAYGEVPTNTLE